MTASESVVVLMLFFPPLEGRGVIIAVIIICILLLAILGSVLYFLYKKGKICGRSGKQDLYVQRERVCVCVVGDSETPLD